MNKPELVCPAGDWSSLITAVDSGADSVYFGIKGINMRARANNFNINELNKVIDYLHVRDKKGFLALNTIVKDQELRKVERILTEAKKATVDAIILSDMSVLQIAKDIGLKPHLSTQVSVSNSKAVSFFSELGVKRIVLARECTLDDQIKIINEIKKNNISCEIEAFIHGAMCVSVSGRCFLSLHTFGKSGNQGECMQPCRREYTITEKNDRGYGKEAEYILGNDYIMSPQDLCTIDFIDKIIDTGIHSLKIEGRMRSKEYIRTVVSIYRKAIDLYFEKKLSRQLKINYKEELSTVYNRGFSDGFYFGRPFNWINSELEHKNEKVFVGEVTNYFKKIGVAEIIIRYSELKIGDKLFVSGKKTAGQFMVVEKMQQEHKDVKEVSRGELVGLKVPFRVRLNDKIFIWKEKNKA